MKPLILGIVDQVAGFTSHIVHELKRVGAKNRNRIRHIVRAVGLNAPIKYVVSSAKHVVVMVELFRTPRERVYCEQPAIQR